MKYGIWRHEDALGNSACHVYALCRYLNSIKDDNAIVYVEKEFQKHFVSCIPNIKEIRMLKDEQRVDYEKNWGGYDNELLKDIKMPDVYPFKHTFPSDWKDLIGETEACLKFPTSIYKNKHNLPSDSIVITIRENGTFWKRVDGSTAEPSRFVIPKTFFDIALYYANKGYKVVRLGDKNQTPLPKHENIIDFAMEENRTMMDDLYVISKCKVHLSCDSGVWPMTAGLKRNLILSNVTSAFNKIDIVDWLPKERSKYFFKDNMVDNTFEQLKEAVNYFLEKK